ncbi:hypothetical protein Baya_2645 [Bagarius yarrelli]|uniref:Uncharacterized protein n=1 Tax=Bagarius yarrelli TaxID=175774 RepID=A0A556VY29_BAGYA|nr:hypothetical protein Baya_2645 [Bagarius yarrelli]
MDDLDYSVIIAERDWESFYEESEECSIQQAWLASLDDSGFSDTDDEKQSTQVPDLDFQIGDHKPKKVPPAATKSEEVDYEAESTLEELESLSNKIDNSRSATHTSEINLNDVSTTHACSTSDSSVMFTIYSNQQHTDSNIRNHREHNENHIKDKLCQAVGEANTSFSYNQEGSHVESLKVLKVSENLPTPKKEKERWFVTVNDSPVKQKAKSGQKKGRKKKTSKKLVRHRLVTERHCSVSNNNIEEETKDIKDEPILQNKFTQSSKTFSECIDFNPSPGHFCEKFNLDSRNDKEFVLYSTKEHEKAASEKTSGPEIKSTSEASSSAVKEKNTSCVFNSNCKTDSDVLTETLKNNAVINDQSMCFTTLDNSSHKAFKEHQSGGSRLIQEATITSLENLQNQEYPTQMQKELQPFSQETQNNGSQINHLEAGEGPNGPVYALSSFWEEMEKLTINDILHLRSVHNRSPMSRSVISSESDVHTESEEWLNSKHEGVQESGLMDDSADSDYFTHVDDSKPDRSSCELSVFSDCDEFLQIPNRNENSCSEPQYVKEQTDSLMSKYIPGHEFELNIDTELLDLIKFSNQDVISHSLYPTILSFDQTSVNQSMFTFSDILATDINRAISSDRLRNTAVLCPIVPNLSVCELYDDFFSDFEIRKFLFLSPQYKSVPIFNASRSVVRDMVVPYMGKLDINPYLPISDISSQPEMPTYPLETPNLCYLTSQRGNWNSLFSHRRVSFIGKGSIWHHKDISWIFPKEAKKECVSISAQQLASPIEVGKKSFLQLVEPEQHAVFIPSKQ